MALSIVEWAENRNNRPGAGFYVDRYHSSGRWHMKPGPIRLAPYHRDILSHIFQADDSGQWAYTTVAWCEPAKSGKSALAGLCAQYAALAEANSTVVMASNKQNQAKGIMYKSLVDSLMMNPALRRQVDPKAADVILNDTLIRAIPSNSAGEAGQRYTLALFDELWAYIYRDAIRLWSEFKPDPTRTNSLRLAIGYAGYDDSDLWRDLLETGLAGEPVPELRHIVNPDGQPACWSNGRHFTFWSHTPRQPWQDEKWLNSLGLSDSEYSRMIECNFVEGTADQFVPEHWWQACYDPELKPVTAGDKTRLVAALDLAMGTTGGDHIALVAVGPHRDGYGVKFAQTWQPKDGRFDYDAPGGVGEAIWWLINNCNLLQLSYDPYQAIQFIQQFRRHKWCKEFSQTGPREEADRHLYDLIQGRHLYHYNDEALTAHLLASGADTKGENRMRLVKASRKKIDAAVALSMACHQAKALHLAPAQSRQKPGQQPAAPPREAPAEAAPVTVIYNPINSAGMRTVLTVDGFQRIEPGDVVTIPPHVWANIQQEPPHRRAWQIVAS